MSLCWRWTWTRLQMFLLQIKHVGGIKSARDAQSFKTSVESRSSKTMSISELQKNPQKIWASYTCASHGIMHQDKQAKGMQAAMYGFGLFFTKMTINENYLEYVYSIWFLLLFFQQKAVLITSWNSFTGLLHGRNFAIKISAIRQTDNITCYLN